MRTSRCFLRFIASAVMCLWLTSVAADAPKFGQRIDAGLLEYAELNEASGLAASTINRNLLWTHNDSGDANRIYALNEQGRHKGVFYLKGCDARDWEDIAVGPGPQKDISYIYVANTGDNFGLFDTKHICRVKEPRLTSKTAVDGVLDNVDVISFRYPDGNHDAEALFVDPLTLDIYVITKQTKQAVVFRAAYPQPLHQTVTLTPVATLAIDYVLAASISADGSEILMRAGNDVWYWQRQNNIPLLEVFKSKPQKIPYIPEPQGEAIAWQANGRGYYTVSEEARAKPAHLYYYPRLSQ